MTRILSPVLNLLKAIQEKGYLSGPMAMEVEDGIGFVWTIPPGFRLVVQCVGPITKVANNDHARIRVGISGDGLRWVAAPKHVTLIEGELNKEGVYPPPPNDDVFGIYTHGRILDLIANLVGNPLSREYDTPRVNPDSP